jgi:hypothetical protein
MTKGYPPMARILVVTPARYPNKYGTTVTANMNMIPRSSVKSIRNGFLEITVLQYVIGVTPTTAKKIDVENA